MITRIVNKPQKKQLYIAVNYIYNTRITLISNIYTNKSTRCYSTSKETLATIENAIHKQLTENILKLAETMKWGSTAKDFKKRTFHKMFAFIKKQGYMIVEPQSFIVDCLKLTNVDLFIDGHFGCYDKIINGSLNKEESKILDKFNELEELSDPIEYYILRFCQKNSKITQDLSLRDQIYCHTCILNYMLKN